METHGHSPSVLKEESLGRSPPVSSGPMSASSERSGRGRTTVCGRLHPQQRAGGISLSVSGTNTHYSSWCCCCCCKLGVYRGGREERRERGIWREGVLRWNMLCLSNLLIGFTLLHPSQFVLSSHYNKHASFTGIYTGLSRIRGMFERF